MNRDIEIIRTDTNYWTISIDGKILQLSRYRHRIDLGVPKNVEDILKIIEDVFMWRRTFLDVRGLINGTNLFVLLDAIYPESTIELFDNLYRKQISKSYLNFRDFFFQVFSFTYETRYSKFSLSAKLQSIVWSTPKKPKPIFPLTVQNDEFNVTYISTDINIASFTINGFPFEICLCGQPYMRKPAEVLEAIISIQDALVANDRTKLESVIERIGSIATINIMRICYPELAINHFIDACNDVVRQRQLIRPRSVLLSYFGQAPYRGPARTFFYNLLKILEDKVPNWYSQLFDGNKQELLSSKEKWTIFFYSNPTLLSCYKISFIGADTLQNELRNFLFHRSIDGNKIPQPSIVYRDSSEINICIDILYNHLDIYIESIKSLSKMDVQLLLSYFVQNTTYSHKTITRCLSSLRLFYKFTSEIKNDNPLSAFYKVQFPVPIINPTSPMSQQVRAAILQRLYTLPPVAQIGIKIACCTGLRASSFGELLTSSLINHGEKYTLRVFLKKTFKYRIKNGLPTFIDYRIPKELGIEIEQYIANTQNLRTLLNKPYLFVYQPAFRRSDTYLLPIVFNSDGLAYYLTKLLNEANLYTPTGLPEKVSLRSIRAEMGRTLFASGKNATEVSAFLGNSPIVAQTHYDNYLPLDDAKMYDELWKGTIEKGIASCSKPQMAPHPVMYGTCTSQKDCSGKDCRKCPSLIQCKGGDTNAFHSPPAS